MKDTTETTTTTENPNLPAVQGDNLPAAAPAQIETIEFSQQSMDELFAAIQYAETVDVKEMDAVRVDAVYFKPEKKDEVHDRMIAGFGWRPSEYSGGLMPCVNLYDVKNKQFEYSMQAALVGKCIDAKFPKGQMVRITYLGKVKGKKFQYEDYKVEALIPKKKS